MLAPVVIRFKESITEKTFYKVSFIFLVLASASLWSTGEVRLNWDIGQSFEYLGYFMTGYSLRKIYGNRKNNFKALILIFAGIVLEICASVLRYKKMIGEIRGSHFGGVAPYDPLIVPASVCIFIGFAMLDVKKEYADMAGSLFYIYLIHVGVWNLIYNISKIVLGQDFLTELDGGVWIPVFVIAVFGISYVLSKLYLWIWNKLDKEKRITNYFLKIARLQTE